MRRKNRARRGPTLLNAALAGGLAVFSGSESAAQTAPSPVNSVGAALDEIIVTASRRQTSIEDIPYNISAIGGDALSRTGTTDLAGLANQVPGFNFEDRGARFAGATVPVMRGLNASDTERSGFTPEQKPVGTYLGNSPVVGYLPIQDIQRVEILRGPQGTLYGAGSLGGAVRLIPNDPKLNQWSGSVQVSGIDTAQSSDAGYSVAGLVNAPVGDIAALRVSAKYEHQAGFVDQFGIYSRQGNDITGVPISADPGNPATSPGVYYDKKDANYTNISSGRASLLLQPTADLRVELATNLSYVEGVNGPEDNPSYGGGPWVIDPRITFPATGNYQIDGTTLAPYDRHTSVSSVDASFDMGFATVSSTSTYGETSAITGTDSNALILGLPATYLPYYTGNPINPRYVATSYYDDADHQFTQEIRLVSKSGGTIDYVAGLFYEHDRRSLSWQIFEPGTTAQTVASGGLYVNTDPMGRTFEEFAPQSFQEKTVFGEVTWHLTNQWEVTGGGRLFHQNLSQNQAYDTFILSESGGNNSSTSVSNHIFKFDTSYEYVDQQRAYALFSQGFRRGGTNAFPLTGFYQESPAILNYQPDKANNFEVGFKGVVTGGLRYTADVYYIKWDNPQIGLSTVNTWPVAVNGKEATSKGAEFELHAPLFTPQLEAAVGYSYVDAKLTQGFCLPVGDGTGLPGGFIPCGIEGFKGERLPGTTKEDLSATLTYTQPLPTSHNVIYSLNANYRGSSVNSLGTIATNYTSLVLGGYTLVNASVSTSLTSHLRTGAYVTNLFDKRAVLAVEPQRSITFLGNFANTYTINRPREIEVRMSYDW